MPFYPGLSEAHIAALADRYVASPSETDEAGKAALDFILQDIDRIMARIDAGSAARRARMDALLESLKRPAA